MRSDDRRFDWDVPLGRRWALLLVAAYALPVVLPTFDAPLWIWPWSGWSEAGLGDVLLGLVPLLLGAVAWGVLGLPRRRLRGLLLLVACAASVLVPYGRLFRGLGGDGLAWEAFLRIGWQVLALTLGIAAIVAGNRQQKRSLGRGVAPWIAGLGGAALLAVFFVPVGMPGFSGRGLVPASVFLEGEAWTGAWPALLWLFALLGLGVAGALSPLAARIEDPLETVVEGLISRLARFLPMSLPVVVLGLYVFHGVPGFGYFFLVFAKVLLHGYAVVALTTVGLARVLDGADPDDVVRVVAHPEVALDPDGAEPAASPA